MEITFGISTGFAIKRWGDPKEWIRFVKEELGLDVIQFSFDQFDPRGRKESVQGYCELVRNECEKRNVLIHSTFTGLSIYSHNLLYHPLLEGRIDGLDWFEHAFSMTEKLGTNGTGGPFGGMDLNTFFDIQQRMYMEKWGEEALVSLLQKAKTYGIEHFYWEPTPIMRENPVTIKEIKDFLEKIRGLAGRDAASLSICFDVGHTTNREASGDDANPYAWMTRLSDYISIIHLQQTDGTLDRHWPFTSRYNEIGKINASELIESVEQMERERMTLLLEIGHPFEEDDAVVKKEIMESVNYWRSALKEKGYEI
ncbi:sugar phosphate isomerase/epimerase family protein [Bacillus songklensis]|uniref:Sugar phosphate isomerase/epimerase family protein n=1 Tax=Bacillus songklensis TaxID=1069116 RepID=A0ABV8AVX6_9BACI